MIARPIANAMFMKALFDVLERSSGVIYWPGGGCVVADRTVIDELPPDMIESLGIPSIVKSGQEIFDRIAQSG